MWRYPVWKRTIVMAAGSATHFALGIVILWVLFAFVALPNSDQADTVRRSTIDTVPPCVAPKWRVDPATGQPVQCVRGHRLRPGAPAGPAAGRRDRRVNGAAGDRLGGR